MSKRTGPTAGDRSNASTGQAGPSSWLEERPAVRDEISAELRTPARFGPDARVVLLYPGCGWDFRTFWGPADPSVVIMLDPAPAQHGMPVEAAMAEWKGRLRRQLTLSTADPEDIVFDQLVGEVRAATDEDHARLAATTVDRHIHLRPAFTAVVIVRDTPRLLTFIAARFEEREQLRDMALSPSLRLFEGLPATTHIVYEHKSMIAGADLRNGVSRGGCMIWGLPDTAPTVEWSMTD